MIFHVCSSQSSKAKRVREGRTNLTVSPVVCDTQRQHALLVLSDVTTTFEDSPAHKVNFLTASSIQRTARAGASLAITTMPQKRSSNGDPIVPALKPIKTEHPEEFSNAVKKRLQSSTRTGQACDRCKVRIGLV